MIKHDTICKDYTTAVIKILNKIITLQCSWTRMFTVILFKWKLIPPHLVDKSFRSSFKSYCNLHFKVMNPSIFHLSIEKFVSSGKRSFAMMTETFLHFTSRSLIHWKDPGTLNIYSIFTFSLKGDPSCSTNF